MQFGDKLKELRERKGMSQKELADRLKLRQGTISHYEQGKTEPDFERLGIIANIFDIDVTELIFGDTTKIRKEAEEFLGQQEEIRIELKNTSSIDEVSEKFNIYFNGSKLDKEETKDVIKHIAFEHFKRTI